MAEIGKKSINNSIDRQHTARRNVWISLQEDGEDKKEAEKLSKHIVK